MKKLSNVEIINHFINCGIEYGAYVAEYHGRKTVFIHNGDSVASVAYFVGESAMECLVIVKPSIKKELLEEVAKKEKLDEAFKRFLQSNRQRLQ